MAVRRPNVPAPAPGTEIVLIVPAPCRFLTDNNNPHWSQKAKWRKAAHDAAQVAKLVRGLARVKIVCVVHVPNDGRPAADPLNFRATTKRIVDGLGPPTRKWRKVYGRQIEVAPAPGWGLIDNDDATHLDGEYIEIGERVHRRDPGHVEVRITVLEPLSAEQLATPTPRIARART